MGSHNRTFGIYTSSFKHPCVSILGCFPDVLPIVDSGPLGPLDDDENYTFSQFASTFNHEARRGKATPRTILTKHGITLLYAPPVATDDDRSLHGLYGAWMQDAGFFVAVNGESEIFYRLTSEIRDSRFVVAGGKRRRQSEKAPAFATYRGFMVGTYASGPARDDIFTAMRHWSSRTDLFLD